MLSALCLAGSLFIAQEPVCVWNLSESPFAKYGADLFTKQLRGNFEEATRLPSPRVVLTKYDNLDASVYWAAREKFASISVRAIGREKEDGKFEWWKQDGSPLEDKVIESHGQVPKVAKDSLLVLVSAENFWPRNALLDMSHSWRWTIGQITSNGVIAHFGPNSYWVEVPNPGSNAFCVPVWLVHTQSVGDRLPPIEGRRATALGIEIEVTKVDEKTVTLRQTGESVIRFGPVFKGIAPTPHPRLKTIRIDNSAVQIHTLDCQTSQLLGFDFGASTTYLGYIDGIPATPNSK